MGRTIHTLNRTSIRFVRPVRPGDTVRAVGEVVGL
jgi:acyl dehydratase